MTANGTVAIAILAGCLGVCAASVPAAGGRELYRCDFTDRAAFKADGDWTVTPEGTLLRTSFGGMTSWQPQNWPDLTDREFSVMFEVRELQPQVDVRRDGHWGFSFHTGDGEHCNVFSRGNGLNVILGRRLGDGQHGKEVVAKIPAASRATNELWSAWRLTVNRGGFRAYLNGKLQYSAPFALAPLVGPKFHGYGRSVEFRNFRVVEEVPPKLDFASTPTVRIDGVVTQRELRVEKPVSALGGGVEFWSRFVPGTECVKFLGEGDKVLASFYYCGDFRIQADILVDGSDAPIVFRRRVYVETSRTQEETIHYAFTWDPEGHARFFLNGIPFPTTSFLGEDIDMPVAGNLLDGVKKIVFPPSPSWLKNPQRVSDVKIFRRPLTNREVLDEYRRKMPIDLVFQDSLLTAGEAVTVKVAAAPGGVYMQPHPAPGAPLVKAKVDLRFTIEKVLGRMRGEPVAGGVTEFRGTNVSAPMDISLNPVKLEKGDYRLIVEVNGFYRRTLLFTVMDPIRLADVGPSKESWKKEELIFSRVFAKTNDFPFIQGPAVSVVSPTCGAYVECGPDGCHSHFDRVGTEVFFPTNSFGRPCLLEIDWPDDKARACGFCMHVECRKGSGPHRDSLMEGVIAGGEIRNQNRLRTTQYLFFPSHTNYLFEVRTLIKGRPAAVAAIRSYRLAEPLPRLKVNRPKGLPYRRFGHQDEDQTFNKLLNDDCNGGTAGNLSELLRYFAYTGESTFQYSFLRYTSTFGSIEGSPGNGMFPGKNGEFGSVLRILDEHDIEFVGQFCMIGEPHIARIRQTAEAKYRERGFVTLDFRGQDRPTMFLGDAVGNIANPQLQDLYFGYFKDVLVRNAAAGGFKAVEIPVSLYGSWPSPEHGYDDWTVRRFARDMHLTGNADLKPLLSDAKRGADYQARFDLLWKGALKPQWVKWRAARVTEFFARLVGFIQANCPGMKVYLTIPGEDDVYEKKGIDIDALLAIKGVKSSLGREVQSYWWHLFRDNTMTGIYTNSYDASSPHLAKLKARTGAIDLVRCGQAYFESFINSCDPVGHRAYFQSLDVKPVGRDWLKELAFAVGACDAQETVMGNQQLSTLGVEDMAREFVQAYSALPALPFETMAGSDVQKVVGRFRETINGTYLYFVNMTDRDVEIALDGDIGGAIDLSTRHEVESGGVALKPYQLRSFVLRKGRHCPRKLGFNL